MTGEYIRLTPAELERATEDPDWALDSIEETQDAEEESDPAPAEYFTAAAQQGHALIVWLD